ncbi:MAG: GNAT family N-acetyltransferase [Candidatus Aminicenantes bacterium]|nr:GNAT family N-acetyltransferase [Candidatus Aminicenantes bacterium]
MPELPLLIRKAEMRDAAAICACLCGLTAENGGETADPGSVLLGVKAVLKDAHKGFYLLAENKSEPGLAGMLRVSFAWDDRGNRNFWWLAGAWVEPAWRGRGVFSTLFRHLADLARFHKDVAGLRIQLEGHRLDLAPLLAALGLQKTPDQLYEILF